MKATTQPESGRIMLWIDHMRLALPRFLELARGYQADLRDQQSVLQAACDRFDPGQQVWPDDCEEMIQTLSDLQAALRRFHAWLDDSSALPISVVPLSLQPLSKLRDADRYVTKAIQLLLQFREQCWLSGRPTERRQAEIAQLLESIEDQNTDLNELVRHLLDAARFPARIAGEDALGVS